MLGKVTLAATVAGALLIAGAGTGATLATWHAQTQVVLGTVRSGSIALTVNGASSATLGALGAMKPGDSRTVTATLTNAAPAGAKNLRMGVYLDSASTGNSAVDGQLHVVDARTGGCSSTGQGVALNGYKGGQLAQSLAPQQAVTFCMTLLLPGNATVPPTGLPTSGPGASLQLGFRGQYDAWQATASAATQLGLLPSPPATPAGLACSGAASSVALTWNPASDVTGYQVLQSGTVLASALATAQSVTLDLDKNRGNADYSLVLRATNAGGSADTALTVHVKNNSVSCS